MNSHIIKRLIELIAVVAIAFLLSSCGSEEFDLGFGYVRKGPNIHFTGGGKTGIGINATRIDKPSWANVKGFNRALPKPVRICSAPDAASFKPLSEEYSIDKNKAYYKWISPGRFLVIELPEADVETLEVIGFNLAKDRNQVWYYGAIMPGVDPATVEVVNDGRVWKDESGVWYQQNQISGALANSFQHLGSGYYGDAQRVYWSGKPIDGADVATFKVLGDSFVAVDQGMVYRSGKPQPHLDPVTCKFILHSPSGHQVISDKNGVYLNYLKFLHADPDDFTMIDKLTGRGGKYVFLVDSWHSTPVTVYREGERLVAETILYEKGTTKALAVVRAEVEGRELKDLSLSAPRGQEVAESVPDWQLSNFKRPDLVERMKAAGKFLP